MTDLEILHQFFRIEKKNDLYYCFGTKGNRKTQNVEEIYAVPAKNIRTLPDWNNRKKLATFTGNFKKIQVVAAGLGMPYIPAAQSCNVLDTSTPDAMGEDVKKAHSKLKKAIGNVTEFVCERLQWSRHDCCNYLAAEQIDAVAFAIYNIEARRQGFIVGDQTGIGKGRVAATMIRYARLHNITPFFISEKASLFSDMYRDLNDIGCIGFVPFILNSSSDSNILFQEEKQVGNNIETTTKTIYKANVKDKNHIIESSTLPKQYDLIMATYSQFSTPDTDWVFGGKTGKKRIRRLGLKSNDTKGKFLFNIAPNALFILDEAHNAAGDANSSTRGYKITTAIDKSRGTIFLSATYAKRPDNMTLYATQTCIREAVDVRKKNRPTANDIEAITDTDIRSLADSIDKGGYTLQEVISSTIVGEGQMLRREKEYKGAVTNYVYFNEDGARDFGVSNSSAIHREIVDKITPILVEINQFSELCESIGFQMVADGAIKGRDGSMLQPKKDKKGKVTGVSADPIFSKLHNIIKQVLLSLKIKDVAKFTIEQLKQNKAVVVCVSSTFETILNDLGLSYQKSLNGLQRDSLGAIMYESKTDETKGRYIPDNTIVSADFSNSLNRTLKNAMKFHVKDDKDETYTYVLDVADLQTYGGNFSAYEFYDRIRNKIKNLISDLDVSPIDTLERELTNAGYTYSEVTGRGLRFNYNPDGKFGKIETRKKENPTDAFNKFNQNKVDVLIINQSGSTGKSAHAKPVKGMVGELRERVMIIAEPELDINTEVQKRGRVNRTGQLLPPKYYYMATDIPCEKRQLMVLQRKIKSLDSNTAGNQNNSKAMIDSPDFFNIIGDKLAYEYCIQNPQFNGMIDDPIKKIDKDNTDKTGKDEKRFGNSSIRNLAEKVAGRAAITPCSMQEDFFRTMFERFNEEVRHLKAVGEYTLEMQTLDLDAEIVEDTQEVVTEGIENPKTTFGASAVQNDYLCNPIAKPMKKAEIDKIIAANLNGKTAEETTEKVALMLEAAENYKIGVDFENKQETLNRQINELSDSIKETEKKVDEVRSEYNHTPKDDTDTIEKLNDKYHKLTNKLDDIRERWNTKRTTGLSELKSDKESREFILRQSTDLIRQMCIGGYYQIEELDFAPAICTNVSFANKLVKLNTLATYDKAANDIMNVKYSDVVATFAVASPISKNYEVNLAKDGRLVLLQMIQKIPDGSRYDAYNKSKNNETRMYMARSWDKNIGGRFDSKIKMTIITGNILGYFMSNELDDTKGVKLIEFTKHGGGVEKGVLLNTNTESISDSTKIEILKQMPIKRCERFIQNVAENEGEFSLRYGIRVRVRNGTIVFENMLSQFYNDNLLNIVGEANIKNNSLRLNSYSYNLLDLIYALGLPLEMGNTQIRALISNGLLDSLKNVKCTEQDWQPLKYEQKNIPSFSDTIETKQETIDTAPVGKEKRLRIAKAKIKIAAATRERERQVAGTSSLHK